MFHGDCCFRLDNGDVGGDPALMVNWLKRQGHQMFKRDWLHYGRVRDGKLEFEGLFEATDDY